MSRGIGHAAAGLTGIHLSCVLPPLAALLQKDAEVQALRQELHEVQAEVAEAASLTTAQVQEQIHQLIAEREAWIEEVTAQRAEATGAFRGGLECWMCRMDGQRRSGWPAGQHCMLSMQGECVASPRRSLANDMPACGALSSCSRAGGVPCAGAALH